MSARIPFVGESFSLLAPAAAAQQSMNCYPEFIDDPAETAKGRAIIRATPGAHLLITLGHANIQGMWSGGGRLFVISGGFLYEVKQGSYPGTLGGGTAFTSQDLGGYDALPAQLFGNGTQLGMVTNGQFYIDNGAGAIKARFQLNSTVSIATGTAVTWTGGDLFPVYSPSTADPLPAAVFISSIPVAVASWNSTTSMTLSSAWPGSGNGFCIVYLSSPGDFGFPQSVSVVSWTSGSYKFDPSFVGNLITINGTTYTVALFVSQYVIVLTDASAGIQSVPVAWSAVQASLTLSNAGGDLVTAVTMAFMGSTFFVQRPAGGSPDLGRQVNFSAVNDGTSWSGLDFFTKEGGPDYIQSILADHNQLFIFGTEESEVWQLDPSSGLPALIQGAAAREGSSSRWAPASLNEQIVFIGGSPRGGPVAYALQGYVPVRISTHAVEQAWATFGSFAPGAFDAVAYPYIDQGHLFWVVNFLENCFTWVYDATASKYFGSPQWHQRAKSVPSPPPLGFLPYRWWFHTYIPEWTGIQDGMHIVGDYNSGKLFEMNSAFTDEEGYEIDWRRALPYRWNGGKQIFFGRQDLEMQTGQSATTSPSAEPTITRDYSDDRGSTFINPQTAGIGYSGNTSRRVYWAQGGSSRGRVWRYTGKASDANTLVDLWAEDVDGTV